MPYNPSDFYLSVHFNLLSPTQSKLQFENQVLADSKDRTHNEVRTGFQARHVTQNSYIDALITTYMGEGGWIGVKS